MDLPTQYMSDTFVLAPRWYVHFGTVFLFQNWQYPINWYPDAQFVELRVSVVYISFLHDIQCRYVVFGSTCSFWNNNKKGMFVPDCAYHWHVSSHFMLLKCWMYQILSVHYVNLSFQLKRMSYCTFRNTSKLALFWSPHFNHVDWMSNKTFVICSQCMFILFILEQNLLSTA